MRVKYVGFGKGNTIHLKLKKILKYICTNLLYFRIIFKIVLQIQTYFLEILIFIKWLYQLLDFIVIQDLILFSICHPKQWSIFERKQEEESFSDSYYDFQIAAFEIAQFLNCQESFGVNREKCSAASGAELVCPRGAVSPCPHGTVIFNTHIPYLVDQEFLQTHQHLGDLAHQHLLFLPLHPFGLELLK